MNSVGGAFGDEAGGAGKVRVGEILRKVLNATYIVSYIFLLIPIAPISWAAFF
jgi:hypothetical protein